MRRKIEKTDNSYMALKPLKDINGWEKRGKKYNCKGLVNLLKTNIGIEFILNDEIKQDVKNYEQRCFERRISYLMK